MPLVAHWRSGSRIGSVSPSRSPFWRRIRSRDPWARRSGWSIADRRHLRTERRAAGPIALRFDRPNVRTFKGPVDVAETDALTGATAEAQPMTTAQQRRRGRPGHDLSTVLAGSVAVFNERGYDG